MRTSRCRGLPRLQRLVVPNSSLPRPSPRWRPTPRGTGARLRPPSSTFGARARPARSRTWRTTIRFRAPRTVAVDLKRHRRKPWDHARDRIGADPAADSEQTPSMARASALSARVHGTAPASRSALIAALTMAGARLSRSAAPRRNPCASIACASPCSISSARHARVLHRCRPSFVPPTAHLTLPLRRSNESNKIHRS